MALSAGARRAGAGGREAPGRGSQSRRPPEGTGAITEPIEMPGTGEGRRASVTNSQDPSGGATVTAPTLLRHREARAPEESAVAFEPRASGCTPATVHEGFVVTENCQEDTEPFAFLNCKPSIRQTAVSRPAPHSSQCQRRALRPRARPEHLLVVPPGPRTCRRRLDRAGAGAAGPWRPRAPPPASPPRALRPEGFSSFQRLPRGPLATSSSALSHRDCQASSFFSSHF